MARYTGPRVRVSRRIGFNVFENKKETKLFKIGPTHREKMAEKGSGKLTMVLS